MVTIIGNGHGEPSSNSEQDYLLEMGGLTKKQTFFCFHLHTMKPHQNFLQNRNRLV